MPMNKLIPLQNIIFYDNSNQNLSWEQAIKISLQPLLNQGNIKSEYIDSVIKTVHKLGPYFYLGNSVAMPHSRPEDGVISQGLGFTLFNQGIDLVDNEHNAKLFIGLAATDNESHLDALSKVAAVLGDASKLNQLLKATTVQEVDDIINQ